MWLAHNGLLAASTSAPANYLMANYLLQELPSLSFPFHNMTSESTEQFLKDQWNVDSRGIQGGGKYNLQFRDTSNLPAILVETDQLLLNDIHLEVNYPQGSYSHGTGGVQFVSKYDDQAKQNAIVSVVSYEVAFSPEFDWVKGGKLPGLRGGSSEGCSGGNRASSDGQWNCWSVRGMWRANGQGEGSFY